VTTAGCKKDRSNSMTERTGLCQASFVTDKQNGNPVTAFARQVRRERLARGWSLDDLARETGITPAHWSRIENGHRAPTEKVALAADTAFGGHWFLEEYTESKDYLPPGLRSWTEIEDKATRLSVWAVSLVHGLFQTPDYARVWLEAFPGATPDKVEARLASRMARQQRVLFRDDPPEVSYVVDHTALYRLTGTPETMARQMGHLLEIAALPHVTMQVMPSVAHQTVTSELIIADHGHAYCEHLAGGFVYSGAEVTPLDRLFTTIRSEAYRAAESLAVIRKAEEIWTGEQRLTAPETDRA
jgi:transcriptional regulator with XRE-family HTH domain